MLEIKRRDSLKTQTYEAILNAISEGVFKKEVVYSAQFLADRFNVSRTPVREALLRLKDEGLIRVLPNRGVEITPLTKEAAKNIFQARIAIEGYCAMELVKNRDQERGKKTIATMKKIVQEKQLTKDNDFQFHFEIIKFSANPLLEESFKNMRTKIQIFWNRLMIKENREKEVTEEHLKIFHCIKAGSEKDALKAVQEHMEKSYYAFIPQGKNPEDII